MTPSRSNSWTAALLALLCVSAGAALAKDDKKKKHPTCHETAERVLFRYLEGVKRAKRARLSYQRQNATLQEKIRGFMQALRDSRLQFEKKRRDEAAGFDARIGWAREAQAEIRRAVGERLAGLGKRAAELRRQGNLPGARRAEQAAAELKRALAAGEPTGYKKELGFSSSITGFGKYAVAEAARKAKRMADFSAGKVFLYLKWLGRSMSWEGILASLEAEAKKLASAQRREPSFYLPPLGRSFDGPGIDKWLQGRLDALADARSRISKGTYVLYVPTLGRSIDRNGVQKMMAEAKQGYRETRAAWGTKAYVAYNPLLGRSVSNGDIEKTIAALTKELAAYIAKGDDAPAYTPRAGRTITGTECKNHRKRAQAATDHKGMAWWGATYAAWQQARQKWIAAKKKQIEDWKKKLARHEEVWKEDLRRRKQHIDTTLTWALGETPCGGKGAMGRDPWQTLVDKHLDKLRRLSEDEKEQRRREEDYRDKVYVEKDGTVHGDPRDGWKNALRDTGMTVPSKLKQAAELLLEMKEVLDWLQGHAGGIEALAELRKATRELDRFIKAFGELDKSAPDFFALRRKLRTEYFEKVKNLLQKGILSEARLSKLLKMKHGSGSLQAGMLKKQLKTLLTLSRQVNRFGLPRWSRLLQEGRALGAAYRTAVQKYLGQSVTQFTRKLGKSYQKMSKMEKGLLVLSLVNAAAATAKRVEDGMAAGEAVYRSGVDLAVDMAISGIPITAAAEIGSQILFGTIGYVTGDRGWNDATFSNTVKAIVQGGFDKVAAASAWLGDKSMAIDQIVWDARSREQILANVSTARLRSYLSRVEQQLDALPPGDVNEARLLRSREAFRVLLRAKQGR